MQLIILLDEAQRIIIDSQSTGVIFLDFRFGSPSTHLSRWDSKTLKMHPTNEKIPQK